MLHSYLLPHVLLWIVRVDLFCVVSKQINSSIHTDRARGGQILWDERRADTYPAICEKCKFITTP